MQIGTLLTHRACLRPDRIALVFGEQRLSFANLNRRVNRVAHALLTTGLGKGNRVATLLPNSIELYCYLVDRQKDLIISGGVNVYPRDIEEVVVQHPAVREAAVFGVPDAKWGETPVAAVLLRDGTAITTDELRDWVNRRVGAKYQRLARIEVLDDFPRNVAGKTLKRVLREQRAEED